MIEQKELESFLGGLNAAVTEKSQELGAAKQEAFTELMLEELVQIGMISDYERCYVRKRLGRGVGKVNGYAISEPEARVDLFTTIFRPDEDVTTLTQREFEDALKQAARVFQFASGNAYKEMDPSSEQYVMFERLNRALTSPASLRIVLLTNASLPAGKQFKTPELDLPASAECYDLVRYHRLRSSGGSYEPISIDMGEHSCGPIRCLRMPVCGADYDAYMAILPGQLLHDLYEAHGARLMELNVRSFLQNRGKVNKGIRATILDEPSRFLAYNNGLSATAEAIETTESTNGMWIEKLHGLQVVNGGQTVASLHRAGKVDKADLSQVFVQTKLTVVPQAQLEELVPKISRFANTQNKVNEADFSANNPFHVEMEKLSRNTWVPGEASRWFYERARGQYDVLRAREGTTPLRRRTFDSQNPKRQRFSKTDLARYVHAWDEKPHLVSMGAQKNFVAFMAGIEKLPVARDPDPDFLRNCIAKAILYKEAEGAARRHKFPAYRATAVCYTVAYLSYSTRGGLDLERIWERQAVLPATAEAIYVWMPSILEEIVRTAEGRNVTEWAKKEACWHAVQRLELVTPAALTAEMVGTDVSAPAVPVSTEPKGEEDVALVMNVSAADWLAIAGWSQRSRVLSPEGASLATKLAGQASAGWRVLPSCGEAALAVGIYRNALREGIVSAEQGEQGDS